MGFVTKLGPQISLSTVPIFGVNSDNPTDMMTKPVPTAKFELCSSLVAIKV
jgi:hypothetical protein